MHERAGGNPFFLEEVINSLLDAGILTRHEERWQLAEDFAITRGRFDQPEEHLNRGRFPGPVRPQKTEYLPAVYREVQALDGDLLSKHF